MWKSQRLKTLRERYKETQAEFAQRLGISIWTLRNYEQDRIEVMLPVRLLLERIEEDLQAGLKRELVPA